MLHHDPFLLNADHTALLLSFFREGEGKRAPIDYLFQQAVLFQCVNSIPDFLVCPAIATTNAQEIAHVGKCATISKVTVGKHCQQRQQLELIIGSCQPFIIKFSFIVLQELLQVVFTSCHTSLRNEIKPFPTVAQRGISHFL